MINSLCPRPIGTMLSIALIPVSRGSSTGCRCIIPNPFRSTGNLCSVSISGPPSIGSPSALTTRPSIAFPTGTSNRELVLLTVSPSLTSVSSPNSTQPTLSSSKLKTIPITLLGNRISSPAIALANP